MKILIILCKLIKAHILSLLIYYRNYKENELIEFNRSIRKHEPKKTLTQIEELIRISFRDNNKFAECEYFEIPGRTDKDPYLMTCDVVVNQDFLDSSYKVQCSTIGHEIGHVWLDTEGREKKNERFILKILGYVKFSEMECDTFSAKMFGRGVILEDLMQQICSRRKMWLGARIEYLYRYLYILKIKDNVIDEIDDDNDFESTAIKIKEFLNTIGQ